MQLLSGIQARRKNISPWKFYKDNQIEQFIRIFLEIPSHKML